ncbi:MAG TPA: NUDIX hydrolase [Candidatus Limnocylindrales bacterium]
MSYRIAAAGVPARRSLKAQLSRSILPVRWLRWRQRLRVALARAKQYGHCFRCGAPLPGPRPCVCAACGYEAYNNARPTASLLITDERDRVLLLKRVRAPSVGLWETPGGFCDGWENPQETACREGREELGVDVVLGPFLGMYIGDYEFQGELFPVLDCFWLATLPPGVSIVLDPVESSEAGWFSVGALPDLAFDTMRRAIGDYASVVNREDHSTKGQLAQ